MQAQEKDVEFHPKHAPFTQGEDEQGSWVVVGSEDVSIVDVSVLVCRVVL